MRNMKPFLVALRKIIEESYAKILSHIAKVYRDQPFNFIQDLVMVIREYAGHHGNLVKHFTESMYS